MPNVGIYTKQDGEGRKVYAVGGASFAGADVMARESWKWFVSYVCDDAGQMAQVSDLCERSIGVEPLAVREAIEDMGVMPLVRGLP